MKYAIVILGGAADEPQPVLDGATPLACAHTPALDQLAAAARLGQVRFLPDHSSPLISPGPDAALLALLGYNPARRYPGHAPLNALGYGLTPAVGDWVFNLTLLSVIDGIVQPTMGIAVPEGEAQALVRGLVDHLELPGAEVHAGLATRDRALVHLLIDPAAPTTGASPRDWSEIVTHRPDDIAGHPLRKAMPVGGPAGDRLEQLIEQGADYLAGHELNQARAEMGEPPVTHLWPWGQGKLPPGGRPLKPWRNNFKRSAAIVSQDPAMRGVATLAGLTAVLPEPGEGTTQTLDRLSASAIEALREHDLVIVHTDAPQRAAMGEGVREKVDAIQRADTHLIAPLHEALEATADRYRLLVTPLHTTLAQTQRERDDAVPFLLAGEKITNVVPRPMTEAAALEADLQVPFGHELMEFFLRGGIR
ncbi:MAG: hypothetical protein ACIAXF_03100 [Phycisphaerales bacterium JB063]